MEYVFVYGTLRQQGSNAWRMKKARFVCTASISGLLYQIDWYPGAISSADFRQRVLGEIYEIEPADLLELDDYEGPEYQRVRIETTTADGNHLGAWFWEYQAQIPHDRIIPSGDWFSRPIS